MNKIKSFKDLRVWQKGIEIVIDAYALTKKFPKEELYSLTTQIKRSAVSIPSNIAEGQGRNSTKDFLRYISIAYGSLLELETQVSISEMLGYLSGNETRFLLEKCAEVGRLVNGLRNSLERKIT